MSAWLQDGKSAIQEAFADAFHKIEEGAKAGMQPNFHGSDSQLFPLLIFNYQSYESTTAGMRSCWGSYDGFKTRLPTLFSYNKTTNR